MAQRTPSGALRDRRGRSASGTRLWTWLMLPGTLWMTGFLIAS